MFIPNTSPLSCVETPVLEQGFALKGVRSISAVFEHCHYRAVLCCLLNRDDVEPVRV